MSKKKKIKKKHTRKIEHAARISSQYTESIVKTIRESLLVLDKDLRVLVANRSFYNTFKVSKKETRGKLLYELGNHQWDIPKLRELLEQILPKRATIEAFKVTHSFPAIGKKTMLINARQLREKTGKPKLILLAIEDITEQEKAKEKLTALGELTGTIGHNLRNSLGVMKSYAYLLREVTFSDPWSEKGRKHIAALEKEINVVDRITSNILTYSRVKEAQLGKIELKALIKEVLEKVHVPQNMEVTINCEKRLPEIMADDVQLIQVFSNIIVNAFQAMSKGGKLSVSLMRKGADVEISFVDTGKGIPKENLKRIFGPLFSTKAQGSGLGLHSCQSIIKKHKGSIKVKSKVGAGTQVVVSLPVSYKQSRLSK